MLFVCEDFLLIKISQPHSLVFWKNPETDWKLPFCFSWGNQVDAYVQFSLQKYVTPAALNTLTHGIACLLRNITLLVSPVVQIQTTVTWSFPRKYTDLFNCTTTFWPAGCWFYSSSEAFGCWMGAMSEVWAVPPWATRLQFEPHMCKCKYGYKWYSWCRYS